jgi:ferredoxin--NADP+ reductase
VTTHLPYNAAVTRLTRCHEDLMILRVVLDGAKPQAIAGQYTVLGLAPAARRVAGVQAELPGGLASDRLIQRAYSLSCPILDDTGRIATVRELDYFEFYIVLVRSGASPPALTPRLFALEVGSRLYCSPKLHGRYTLPELSPDANIVLLATGTGEAPHNAILAELLACGHRGRILSVVSVRQDRDLAYRRVHERLADRYANYRYVPLTTREPRNLDNSRPDYVGKLYLQDYLTSGQLERDLQTRLDPANTYLFLCGTPQMIGAPQRSHDPATRFPHPGGMVELLERRGFQVDLPHERGNLHFESY